MFESNPDAIAITLSLSFFVIYMCIYGIWAIADGLKALYQYLERARVHHRRHLRAREHRLLHQRIQQRR